MHFQADWSKHRGNPPKKGYFTRYYGMTKMNIKYLLKLIIIRTKPLWIAYFTEGSNHPWHLKRYQAHFHQQRWSRISSPNRLVKYKCYFIPAFKNADLEQKKLVWHIFWHLFAGVNISENNADASYILLKNQIGDNSVLLHSLSDVRNNRTFTHGRFLAIFPRYNYNIKCIILSQTYKTFLLV